MPIHFVGDAGRAHVRFSVRFALTGAADVYYLSRRTFTQSEISQA